MSELKGETMYYRRLLRIAAGWMLVPPLLAAAQETRSQLTIARRVVRPPAVPLGVPVANAPQAELPGPDKPGTILGLDIRPHGPAEGEAVPLPVDCFADGLDLAELEGMAVANNPALAQANARIEAARGRWVQAGLLPNPNLGYAGNEMGNNNTPGQQGGYIGQTIPLGGKLRLSRAVADQEVRQAMWQRDTMQWRVLSDVRIAFFDALVAQRMVDLTTRLVDIAGQGEQTAAALERGMQVSRVDYLQARIEARSAAIENSNARNGLDAAWRRLAAVTGMPYLPPTRLTGDPTAGIPQLTWDEALGRILAGSPELAAAQAGVGRAQMALRRAEVEPIPDFDAQYSPQRDTGSGSNIHNVQATLNIPLFNRNQGNIRAAQAELGVARRDIARVELDLQSRLAASFESYANGRQQVETYQRDILPDAQTTLDLVADGYRQGEFAYLTLLTAQRTYFQTNLAYLRAIQAWRESALEIEGYLLTGSLGTPPPADPSNSSSVPTGSPMERIGQ
jgi:outer membrane protein, heavy metal efflux system